MILTAENYYTAEANEAYWSASFVKSMLNCPAQAIAELQGKYVRPESPALLVGKYVDAAFEGADALEKFVRETPEIVNSRTGALKKDYAQADKMIARARADAMFMHYVDGERQKIITGEIGGIPFKAKLDFYVPGERIVDLKTVRDFEPMYRAGAGRLNFAEYWHWPLQMAIYQHLEGDRLPCYLACITKQDPPDLDVIEIPQATLDLEMQLLLEKLPLFDAMRRGIVETERCGRCAWCRMSKTLRSPTSLDVFEMM